jgi:capsular exopolysaccharide synthesis family protein
MVESFKTIINGNGQIKTNRVSNFQKQWKLIKKYKFLFLISCLICLSIVFLINRYTKPIYLVSTKISVSENNNNTSQLLLQNQDQAALSAGSTIDKAREIAVLTSIPFIEKTIDAIDAIDFKVSYLREDKIGQTELYKSSPFKITFPNDSLYSKINGKRFGIKFKSAQTFVIKNLSENDKAPSEQAIYTIGKNIMLNGCPVIVSTTLYFDSKRDIGRAYFFYLNNASGLAWGFKGGLGIISEDTKSGIIQIQLKTSTPDKGVEFLNELTKQYIKDKYEEKSRSASQSLAFINEQISAVRGTLGGTESNLASFKAANTFSNPETMTNRNLDALADVQNETFTLKQQDNYYSSLINDLNSNTSADQLIAPTSVGIQDAATSNLIKELADLQTQKNSFAASGDSKNPYLQDIEMKLSTGKRALRESVNKLQNTNRSRLGQLSSRAGQFQSNVYRIPLAERQFTDINRSRDFNAALYEFLMQKRVEAGIMKASATIEDRIIEPAFSSDMPIAPKPTRNYIFGLLFGFLLPLGYIKLQSAFNKEVGSKDEIQDNTTIPIIGSIYHNLNTNALVIKKDSRTAVSESFRILRYNLTQFAKDPSKKVILFTSSRSGEGKSFSSINFALSVAIAKKKTVLINLDLRLPSKTYEELATSNDIGISSYLNDLASIKDIIQKTDNPYLDYVPTGELPTNPAELLMEGTKLESLIEYLRTIYEYIIIDTPPLGVVADPLIISSYSDVNVLIVREKYSLKENLFELEDMYKEGKIKDVVMVVNDVRLEKQGYKNAYYYKK